MKAVPIISVLLLCLSLGQACCPPLWSQFKGGRCFRYVGLARSWFEAREYCYNLNPGESHLVTVNSASEGAHIHKIFEENGAEKFTSYWIGLRDFYKNQRRFEWDDGTPFKSTSYTFWNTHEPNNNDDQSCVEVYRNGGRWNDYSCTALKRPFFCEMQRP